MNYVDHAVLYHDFFDYKYKEMIDGRAVFWRKYANKKLRRSVRDCLRGVKPRI